MKKNKTTLALVGILTAAAFLRFWRLPELFLFSGETNNVLYAMQKLASGGQSPLLGLVAAEYVQHLFHTPWYLYLMLPVYFGFGGNPLGFAILHSFLGVLGTYLVFKTGKLLFSAKAGLAAAVLNTFWLGAITVDRSVWSVGLIPFGSIMALYLAAKLRNDPNRIRAIILGTWLGIWLSFHYQAILSILVILIWVWLKRREYFKEVIVLILVSIIPLAVFDIRHDFFNARGLWLVLRSLTENTRPYSAGYFCYQFHRPLLLLTAGVLVKINWKLIILILTVFSFWQIKKFSNYRVTPNYTERLNLCNQVLDKYEDGLEVYFKIRPSYEYRYLFELTAERRGFDPKKITIYEPWQPDNNSSFVLEVTGEGKDILIVRK